MRSIRGVITIVGFGDSPAIVPDQIVEDLRREVRDEETIVIQPQIEVGEEVNVIAGPFQGLRAIVSRVLPARERVAVLLEVLGMEREVEVSKTAVLPDLLIRCRSRRRSCSRSARGVHLGEVTRSINPRRRFERLRKWRDPAGGERPLPFGHEVIAPIQAGRRRGKPASGRCKWLILEGIPLHRAVGEGQKKRQTRW